MKPSNLSPLRVHQLSNRMATACLILILAADYLAPAAATANRQEDAHETHRATADSRICELLRPDRALDLSGFGSSSEPVDWQLAGKTSEISRFTNVPRLKKGAG